MHLHWPSPLNAFVVKMFIETKHAREKMAYINENLFNISFSTEIKSFYPERAYVFSLWRLGMLNDYKS